MKINRLAAVSFAIIAAASCGTPRKAAQPAKIPTTAEADSIMKLEGAAVFVVEKPSGPVIYAFTAHKDSALVDVHSRTLIKNNWTRTPVVTYPAASETGLPLTSGPEDICRKNISGTEYLSFTTTREKGGHLQKTVSLYHPETDMLYNVSFDGKNRRDGKFYGQTDLSMQANSTLPQKVWADSVLKRTANYVILSEEQIMSDQAIDWWLEKNPAALTSATKITFGALPAECSLVRKYQKTKKENGQPYRAALFDTTEYTVVVAQNRSSGEYFLVWAEPRCRNSKTDRFLNSVYFSSATRLTLFYYKGSHTFKYSLSLASGKLQR